MRFQVLDILPHLTNPVTGREIRPDERFSQALTSARYAEEFGPEYATLIELLATERDALRQAGRSTEGLDWQPALDSGMLDLIREGRLAEAKERLQACLSSSSA